MNISILIPTKNRIHNIKNVLKTIKDTSEDISNIEMIFYVDNDDYASQDMIESYENINIKWVSSNEKILFSDMWNKAYEISTGKYIMLCGDDVEFRTTGWDKKVLNYFKKYKDEIMYLVPKDGYQNGALGVHGFVSKKWIELIGYFTPPYFKYWYADTWLDEVSKKINRYVYAEDIEVIHCHPATPNKKTFDSVYQENFNKIDNSLHELYKNKQGERDHHKQILLNYIINNDQKYNFNLSILICSINKRKNLLEKLIFNLNNQILINNLQKNVEILVEVDDEKMPIGKKRNILLQKSSGKYVVFIDDDDSVSEDYIKNILNALDEEPDVIGFAGTIFYEGKFCNFHNSIKNVVPSRNEETAKLYTYISHINPIKSSIAKNFSFLEKFWGEDKTYISSIKETNLLKKEYFIDKIMYNYTPSNEDLDKILKDEKAKNE